MKNNALGLDAFTLRQASPYGAPFVLIDSVEGYSVEAKRLVAFKNVSQSEPFLQGHFPEFPILPGVLIIEALAQVCRLLMRLERLVEASAPPADLRDALLAQEAPRCFMVESSMKHTAGVFPGHRMRLEAQVLTRKGDLCTFRVSASADGTDVGRGRIVLLWSSQDSFDSQSQGRELE
jgi:3-hydroxyacyl-[acyl-carrier-protein] dehydratase